MIRSRLSTSAACIAQALLLAGCGGGGGGSGAGAAGGGGSGPAFALQSGFKAQIQNGYTINFDVTGTCHGTATQVRQPAAAASFEGGDGFKSVATQSLELTDCTPASTSATGTEYFDSAYAWLGSIIQGAYGVNQAPGALPASVQVGDIGSVAVEILYPDSTKTKPTGKTIRTYGIGADGASSAIVLIINGNYDDADKLVFTETDKYRMAADGSLTLLSVEVQYAGTNALHLLMTPR
jgi:hypothetical protein